MIWILLPSYNEGARLEKTVERIWQSLPEDKKIVVVDDGSTLPPVNIDIDGVEVIKHGVNMGLAMALLTGFRRIVATAKDEDLLVTMDADNTMDPEVITDMVTAVDEGAKLVIASRYVRGARVQGVPPWRKLLSRIASWVAGKIIAVPGVKDYSSGFRAYRVDALRAALEVWGADFLSSSRGFEAQIEILYKMKPIVGHVREVPIRLDYRQKVGQSHFNFFRTLYGYLRQIFFSVIFKAS